MKRNRWFTATVKLDDAAARSTCRLRGAPSETRGEAVGYYRNHESPLDTHARGRVRAPAAPQSAKLEPIAIALPKPLFEGTPVPTKVPNLEKPSKNPRPPFLAPAGTVNLALHKPVTSSDSDPVIGNLEMITDGNKAGIDGTYVELKPGIAKRGDRPGAKVHDLRHPGVALSQRGGSYSGVVVQVADDPDFIVNVRTLFNNDSNNESGSGIGKDQRYVETTEGKLIDAKGAEARYVRLFSNGSDKTPANHYIEVEIFGKAL